ncbi:MAG: hypothetical protein ACTTH7_04615 [Treponema sp.]
MTSLISTADRLSVFGGPPPPPPPQSLFLLTNFFKQQYNKSGAMELSQKLVTFRTAPTFPVSLTL